LEIWEKHLDPRDLVIADSIFQPFRNEITLLCSHKSTGTEELKSWHIEENRQIGVTKM
jgi:hypothetical protein